MPRSSLRSSVLLALSLALASGVSTSPAHAQGEDRAVALDLFEQGRALVAHGDYKGALPKFEAAAKVMRTFGVLLNVAETEEKLGRTASAWATWREARAIAADAHRAADEAMATARQGALEPKLNRLTIVVPSVADLPELELRRDGVPVPRAAWGSALPVDPGTHVIELRASGRTTKSLEVVVDAGTPNTTTTVPVLDLAGAPPAPPVVAAVGPVPVEPARVLLPAPQPPTETTGSGQRIAGWVVGGIGLATAVAGIAVALEGQSQHNDAVTLANSALAANPSQTTPAYEAAAAEESGASSTKTAGYAIIGTGGAMVVTGVILLLAAPASAKTGTSTVALRRWVTRTGAGGGFSMEW